jgi:DNA-binding beta-propeller fold protein YncE/mono/diheme cytochrome c family protein
MSIRPLVPWNKSRVGASEAAAMPTARWMLALGCLALAGLVAPGVSARSKKLPVAEHKEQAVQMQMIGSLEGDVVEMDHFGRFNGFVDSGPFTLRDAPVGGTQAPAAAVVPASLAGGRIASFRGGAIAIDEDSGDLVRTDAQGKKISSLAIAPGAGQLVVDAKAGRAFVADRASDRIAVVDLAEMKVVDAFSTRVEPYGVALTPDRRTLLVTTVADHELTAFDVDTGLERWSVDVGSEPRGVAIAPSGEDAMVTFLTTGVVGRVHLGNAKSRPKISYVTLDPAARQLTGATVPDALSDQGKSFARNAFAAAWIGHDVAVVPHQLSTPHLATDNFETETSGYGGGNGFTPPVSHRLAFLGMPDAGSKSASVRTAIAETNLHQPRALAYDGRSDTLYVAGYGSDDVLALANVSQASVRSTWQTTVSAGAAGCGPDGLAVDPDDGHVLVWCSLTREIVRLSGDPSSVAAPTVVERSAELATSTLSVEAQRGRELFRRGRSPQISTFGAMACASCHAEARTDGLSWRLQGKNLQTPLLAGRLEGAHPFKWDGKDPDLTASLTNTVTRLGGSGISKAEADDLAAFLQGVQAPRKPSVDDATAVARGKKLFDSEITGCATCHSGPLYTDQNQYDLSTDLGDVDTPSLVGLATSAPYYHDGSAATLDALLKGNASIHGMGDIAQLSDAQISDLVQYLETL